MEAFDADVALLPQWVQIWMNVLGGVIVLSTLAFLIRKDTRMIGLYMLVTTVASFFIMTWIHGQMGMVRLLGIVHVVFWTPLVIYMWKRLHTNPPGKLYTIFFWITMTILTISLAFDYADVVRWVLGERGSVVG